MAEASSLEEVLAWLYEARPLAEAPVEARARLVMLDTIGCFVGALGHPEPAALVRELARLEPGKVRLPGLAQGLSPGAAAFALALGACWDEACEGLARAHGRPGLHALPAALALGLAEQRDLGAVLSALVTGYEVGGRMGEVLRIKPGMHVDGAWGALGAAAAAARILSEDPALALTAIRTAACQVPFSLYAPIAAGATARNTYPGHGAALGLSAALAAAAGLSAPADAIEAYAALALDGSRGSLGLSAAGEYLVLDGYLKPFAAVRHVHYGAQAALDWRDRHGPDVSKVDRIGLAIYEEARRYCGNRAPATAIQAQFSLSYGLARSLLTGKLGPEAYRAEALTDPETRRLEALVEIETDDALTTSERRGARLVVVADGKTHEFTVSTIPGDPAKPLAAAEARAKFLAYAGPEIGTDRAADLADAILQASLATPLEAVLTGARQGS